MNWLHKTILAYLVIPTIATIVFAFIVLSLEIAQKYMTTEILIALCIVVYLTPVGSLLKVDYYPWKNKERKNEEK